MAKEKPCEEQGFAGLLWVKPDGARAPFHAHHGEGSRHQRWPIIAPSVLRKKNSNEVPPRPRRNLR